MADYINNDPFADVRTAQGLAETGVQGYGDSLQPQLRRTIGSAIGGLNAIGALRSGGTVQALNDISTDYGNQIGSYAKMATENAMQTGLGANAERRANQQFQYQQDQIRRAQQGGILRTIGGVLGAGVGFLAGGPAGAAAGYGTGSSLTGYAGPGGGGTGSSGYGPDDPTFYAGY